MEDGTNMNELTPDQHKALDGILEFVERPINEYKDCSTILYAAAGCGKTYLTRHIVDALRGKYTIAGVAPTHKARKVLDKFLNNRSFFTIKTLTVASLLSKLRNHSYIGTKNYKGAGSKINLYDMFIIDEASMINDDDIKKIITYAFKYKRKLIFVGDKYQIPNPSQKYDIVDNFAYRADSSAFNIPGFELTTNIRQKDGNPIIPLYLEFKSAIDDKREPNITRENNMVNGVGVEFYTDRDEWYEKLDTILNRIAFDLLHTVRIIAYTNDAVKSHNQKVRKLLNNSINLEVGELLMGYNNIGFPDPYVSNGQDYYITNIVKTTTHNILYFNNLVGRMVTTRECDTKIMAVLFIPDIGDYNNQEVLQELAKRADKVNKSKSTVNDYRHYKELRDKLIFMNNIYKFHGEIVDESQFRNSHPLLFKRVNEVIDYNTKTVLSNKLVSDIQEKYGDLLMNRINDNKIYSDIEKLSDRMCIIEKDIDYGYAITAHKSQGSTYKTVFIDEYDFEKLRPHFNYHLGCDVKTVKEKNQLKYVSFTRPTDGAHVFYREVV